MIWTVTFVDLPHTLVDPSRIEQDNVIQRLQVQPSHGTLLDQGRMPVTPKIVDVRVRDDLVAGRTNAVGGCLVQRFLQPRSKKTTMPTNAITQKSNKTCTRFIIIISPSRYSVSAHR